MMTTSNDRPRRFNPWLGGLTLIGLGATLVVTGLLQTTSSHVTSPCPDGTELIAKFNFSGGRYVFEKPDEYAGVVTISNGSATGGDAHSSIPVTATIVKGGPDSVLVTYSPAQTNLHFSNAGLPLVGAGNLPDISNIQFCGNTTPPTTTTTIKSTTTTTTKPTTTTSSSTTTTTIPPTTTTKPPTTTSTSTSTSTSTTTTTTVPPTTTTRPPTTTSTSTSTTTSTTTTTTTTLPPTTTKPPVTTTSTTTSTTVPPTTTTTTQPTTTSTSTSTSSTSSTTVASTTTTAPVTTASSTSTIQPPAVTTTSVGQEAPVVTSTSLLLGGGNEVALPRTGAQSIPLIALGMVLMAIGLTLTVLARARVRRASS